MFSRIKENKSAQNRILTAMNYNSQTKICLEECFSKCIKAKNHKLAFLNSFTELFEYKLDNWDNMWETMSTVLDH